MCYMIKRMKAFGKNREDIQLLIFLLESAIMYTYIYRLFS